MTSPDNRRSWWAQVRVSNPDTKFYDYFERPEADGDPFFDSDDEARTWCEQRMTSLAGRYDWAPLSGHVVAGHWQGDEFVEEVPARQWVGRWDGLDERWVWAFDGPDGLEVRP